MKNPTLKTLHLATDILCFSFMLACLTTYFWFFNLTGIIKPAVAGFCFGVLASIVRSNIKCWLTTRAIHQLGKELELKLANLCSELKPKL
jgi:hypothetical protein